MSLYIANMLISISCCVGCFITRPAISLVNDNSSYSPDAYSSATTVVSVTYQGILVEKRYKGENKPALPLWLMLQ